MEGWHIAIRLYSKEEDAWNFSKAKSLAYMEGERSVFSKFQEYEEIWRKYEGIMKKYDEIYEGIKEKWRNIIKEKWRNIKEKWRNIKEFPDVTLSRGGGVLANPGFTPGV